MWILNVEFSASTWNFLSLVILSAIFNVRVLGFSMYFCLKNNKDLLFIYLFIYLFTLAYYTCGQRWLNCSQKAQITEDRGSILGAHRHK